MITALSLTTTFQLSTMSDMTFLENLENMIAEGWATEAEVKAASELRRLHAENEALKSELRMEQTISFRVQMQQYAAQRDALLEALKEIAYAAECVETGRPGDCDIDYPSWFAKARAAIAKATAW